MVERIGRAWSIYVRAPQLIVIQVPAVIAFGIGDYFGHDWISSSIITFGSILVVGALVAASGSAARGEATTIPRAYRESFARLPTILFALVALAFAVALSLTVIGIPFGVLLFGRWFFAIHAGILANQRGRRCLSFSASLVEGRWWLAVRQWLPVSLAVIVSHLAILALANYVTGSAQILLLGLDLVSVPFVVTYQTVLFFDLTHDRQGYSQGHVQPGTAPA